MYRALFPAFDRLEVELATGGRLLLEFEGDLWETEDHRNWTDANFKTYSTPIGLGRPAPLEAGQVLRQRLLITPVDVPTGAGPEGGVRLDGRGADRHARAPGRARPGPRPPPARRPRARAARCALTAPTCGSSCVSTARTGATRSRRRRRRLRRSDRRLEVSLHLLEEHAAELPAVAAALAGGPSVARVLVINADSRMATPAETTRPGLMDAVRGALGEALPDAAFVGGTQIYFTEINRTRPEHGTWDGICYSITPQIHAFTDVDVVENLDAQAETVRSARAFAGDKPVVVSPITMRRRVNFHAAGEPPPDAPGELPGLRRRPSVRRCSAPHGRRAASSTWPRQGRRR